MTYRQKTYSLCQELGWDIEIIPCPHWGSGNAIGWIEIFFPDGIEIDDLTSLICHNWKDAYKRVREYKEIKENLKGGR